MTKVSTTDKSLLQTKESRGQDSSMIQTCLCLAPTITMKTRGLRIALRPSSANEDRWLRVNLVVHASRIRVELALSRTERSETTLRCMMLNLSIVPRVGEAVVNLCQELAKEIRHVVTVMLSRTSLRTWSCLFTQQLILQAGKGLLPLEADDLNSNSLLLHNSSTRRLPLFSSVWPASVISRRKELSSLMLREFTLSKAT